MSAYTIHRELEMILTGIDSWDNVASIEDMDTGLTWAIKWPNTDFNTKGIERFIEVAYLDSSTSVKSFSEGAHAVETGIMQITIYTPQGIGAQQALQQSDVICKLYPIGALAVVDNQQISITNKQATGQGINVGNFYAVPISIYYSSYDLLGSLSNATS